MPERPIADARIEVRTRGLTTRSEPNGRFRLMDVPPGEYVVVVRALGFDSLVVSIRLAANDVVDVDFLLTRTAQAMAPVQVEADRTIDRLRLAEFDERRAMGFGRFLDRSVFEENSASQVDVVLIGRVPGLRTRRVSGKTVLAAQRDAQACYPQVVVNGISVFNGAPTKIARETLIFDVSSLRADEIIGFEWHNPSSTPSRYNATGAGGDGSYCGTAIFWTK
ncbi:MAG: carboxypeptidase regulatory-like domain-containing protein [Gemmatimonadaceae bacterium]|nr:carboxypeptidase regulatory-like domain-containing protein [Gemmatimonadaceae bacterium]